MLFRSSPFDPVEYEGRRYPIAQCNNSYIFPGIGLGVLASGAQRISDEMMLVSSEMLAKLSPQANNAGSDLLPDLRHIADLSQAVAFAVGKVAREQGHAAEISDEELLSRINEMFWKPQYQIYKRIRN